MPSSHSFLVGLLGAGIQASRTPSLHEYEGAAQGLRYVYRRIDIDALRLTPEALPELLRAAERMGYDGLNVTYPFKQTIVRLLTDLSEDARQLGAVNTVLLRDGQRIGYNTDWWGFAESFRRGLSDVPLERVMQLGAGGAGAAVAHAALTLGVSKLSLLDVDPVRAQQLASHLGERFGAQRVVAVDDVVTAMRDADGLIHATPTGMAKHPGLPLPPQLLHPRMWVAEIVYLPLETELLRVARALGCRTLDGSGMAVFQAVEAFRLFTGITPDAARMQEQFARIGAA
jgi:shikimate dehydrogenase